MTRKLSYRKDDRASINQSINQNVDLYSAS